jgi:ABC-2 type transport system ATP-binding protein
LKRQLQREAIFELEVGPLNGVTPEELRAIAGVRRLVQRPAEGGAALEFILEEEAVLPAVVGRLADGGVPLRHLQKREPTLEDVFVKLVGMRMEEVEKDAGD